MQNTAALRSGKMWKLAADGKQKFAGVGHFGFGSPKKIQRHSQ
jgi:hypothetical protein